MKRVLFLFVFMIFSSVSYAQLDVSLNGLVLSPQGQFKENLDQVGFGFSLSGAYNFNETPFALGLNMGYGIYGSDTRREILVFPVEVDVTTSNNIFFMHLFARIHKNFGFVSPYVEGLAGFSHLWTDTKIEDLDNNDEDDIASSTQLADWASNYGFGAGLMFRMTEFDFNTYQENVFSSGILFLDFKVRYMFGGSADYLKEGDISQGPDNEVILNKSRSETDFITYNIGVVLYMY